MKNLSLTHKIFSVLIVSFLMMAGMSWLSLTQVSQMHELIDHIVHNVAHKSIIAEKMEAQTNILQDYENTIIFDPSPEEKKIAADSIYSTRQQIDKYFKEYSSFGSDKEKIAKIEVMYANWDRAHDQVVALADQGLIMDAYKMSHNTARKILFDIDDLLTSLVEKNEKIMEDEYKESEAIKELLLIENIAINALAIVVVSLLAFLILKKTTVTINRVVDELKKSHSEMDTATNDIANAAENLYQESTKQSSSVTESASALEEISAMAKLSSENSSESADLAQKSQNSAKDGQQQTEEMARAMAAIEQSLNEIQKQSQEGNIQMKSIVDVINEIVSKTQVINSIVVQTKLLSFNASVEAARAGESGKGFAVVAEEVGNLAQMSGKAAKEISELLDSSSEKVHTIVAENEENIASSIATSQETIKDGKRIVNICQESLAQIVDSSGLLNTRMQEIATANREQGQGISEVNTAMAEINTSTVSNVSNSQQTSNAAQSLTKQSGQLTSIIADLSVSINGANDDGNAESNSADPQGPDEQESTCEVYNLRGERQAA